MNHEVAELLVRAMRENENHVDVESNVVLCNAVVEDSATTAKPGASSPKSANLRVAALVILVRSDGVRLFETSDEVVRTIRRGLRTLAMEAYWDANRDRDAANFRTMAPNQQLQVLRFMEMSDPFPDTWLRVLEASAASPCTNSRVRHAAEAYLCRRKASAKRAANSAIDTPLREGQRRL